MPTLPSGRTLALSMNHILPPRREAFRVRSVRRAYQINNAKFTDGLTSLLAEINKFIPGAVLTRISSNEIPLANYRGDIGVPMMMEDESFIAGLQQVGSTSGASLDIASINKLWVESK